MYCCYFRLINIYFSLLSVFIPKVPQKNKLCNKIYLKTQNNEYTENGSMYGQCTGKDYAVTVPSNKQSKFGKTLTSRYRKSTLWFNTCYVAAGAARMVTDEKTVIGELNDSGLWINGRLEIDDDTSRIFYRKYDEKGNNIKNSTQEFVDFVWLKSAVERTLPDAELANLFAQKAKAYAERTNPFSKMKGETNKKELEEISIQLTIKVNLKFRNYDL